MLFNHLLSTCLCDKTGVCGGDVGVYACFQIFDIFIPHGMVHEQTRRLNSEQNNPRFVIISLTWIIN